MLPKINNHILRFRIHSTKRIHLGEKFRSIHVRLAAKFHKPQFHFKKRHNHQLFENSNNKWASKDNNPIIDAQLSKNFDVDVHNHGSSISSPVHIPTDTCDIKHSVNDEVSNQSLLQCTDTSYTPRATLVPTPPTGYVSPTSAAYWQKCTNNARFWGRKSKTNSNSQHSRNKFTSIRVSNWATSLRNLAIRLKKRIMLALVMFILDVWEIWDWFIQKISDLMYYPNLIINTCRFQKDPVLIIWIVMIRSGKRKRRKADLKKLKF